MADSPEMVVSDPDAPTEQSVRQALANLPTWEEWLQQHEFTAGPNAFTGRRWDREWKQHGRGWWVRIAPAADTINIIVYNNPLRHGKQLAMVSVAERSVPGVVANLIAEIERKVSDATKKRRIVAYTSGVDWQDREDRVITEAKPEVSLPFWVVESDADLDDPGKMSQRQLDRILNRVQTGCYVKGQRVRVKPVTHGGTRLVGKEGIVVSANDNSCYVALDDFVAAGDPDPFRFMQDEVEPIFENQEPPDNLDAPEPYLKALDYMTPLAQMGYTKQGNGEYKQAYGGNVYGRELHSGDRLQGYLMIRVQPQVNAVAAIFMLDYVREGESSPIADIVVPALDVADVATRIERLVRSEQVNGISELATAMHADPFISKHTMIVKSPPDHLLHVFGEAQENADDPQSYLDELVRRSGFVDVFRRNGMRLQRPPGAGRPYYSLFWIPNAVTEVSYDLYLEPMPNGDWEVSAEGLKMFTVGDREISEPFDINWTMLVPAAMPPEEALEAVKEALLKFTGPAEPTPLERDWDDLDESEEGIDFTQYAKDSASYNPVQLLTAADIRRIVREAGYRVRSLYRSQRTTGWTLDVVPGPERMGVFRDTPYAEQDYLDKAMFTGITKRLPMLGQMLRGCYVYYEKLEVRCWYDLHTQSVRIDIWPIDHQHRKKGILKPKQESVDDPASYVDRLQKAQYCPRCLSHDTECIGPHSALSGGYGNGMPQEFWQCNVCGDKFLWSDDRSVGFKLEGIDDPDDAESMVKRVRPAKMGEVVNIICPKCGLKKQVFKNWPDDAPRGWGYQCQCGAFIPLVNIVVEAVAVPPPVRLSEAFPEVQDDPSDDPTQYIKTTFDPEQFLLAAGWKHEPDQNYAYYTKTFPMPHYQLGGMTFTGVQVRVGFWDQLFHTTAVTARLVDDKDSGLGVNGWQLSKQELYPWADEDGAAPDTNFDKTMPVRRFAMGIGGVLAGITWPESRFAAQHASSLVNTEIGKFVKNLNAQAAKPLHNESNYIGENAEDVDKPERYIQQLGTVEHVALIHGMTKLYTSDTEGGWMRTIKLRHPIEIRSTDYLSHLGMNAIRELRLVVRYERKPNTLFPKQQKHELTVFVRVPYVGENSGSKLSHILWRTGAEFTQESSAAHALNQVLTYAQQSLDDSHEALNLQRTKEILNMGVSPFMADVNESEDPDDPKQFVKDFVDKDLGVTFLIHKSGERSVYAADPFHNDYLVYSDNKDGQTREFEGYLRRIIGGSDNNKWEAYPKERPSYRAKSVGRFDTEQAGAYAIYRANRHKQENLDVDSPESLMPHLPPQTFVTFTRRFEEDQEYAEANFPGEPLAQALGKQLLREIAEANVFDMATIRVVGFERVDDDVYKVKLAFSGDYGADETLRDLIQSTYREGAVAGEFNIEQYRPVPVKAHEVRCRHCGRPIRQENGVWVDPAATGDDSTWRETCDAHDTFTAEHEPDDPTRSAGPQLEALDPDDPTDILQSQPGFEFRKTGHMGVMVFVKGPGEDTSAWPRDIGRIILGPSPDPTVNPEQRWYVVDVRGVPQEKLSEIGFGLNRRTFDSPDEAALAIWLTRSRMPEKEGVLGKRRRLPESDKDVDAPDLEHWSGRLSVELRLDSLYGRGHPYMKDDPDKATQWAGWFRWGEFEVWSTFVVWYKVKNAPSANISYEIKHGDFHHHDSEMLHGRGNILKLVELLEKGVERLKASPPRRVSDVTRVWQEVFRFAYTAEQNEPYDPAI